MHVCFTSKIARRSSRALVVALVAVSFGLPGATAQGAARSSSAVSSITAPSFVAVDAASGRILLARRATARRPIASLTKVMTALVVIGRGGLGARVTVTPAAVRVEDYREGLVVWGRYRRMTLLRSALMVSANDSATALAIDAGGGSLGRFYALMNARARSIGMTGTTYASASGLDDVRNLSTALDQAVLARAALRSSTFASIVGTARYVTSWPAPTYRKVWVNHNKMLRGAPGTYGVKTGWTTRAGGCLVVAQHRGERSVIGVLLGSESIWADMRALLDAAFST